MKVDFQRIRKLVCQTAEQIERTLAPQDTNPPEAHWPVSRRRFRSRPWPVLCSRCEAVLNENRPVLTWIISLEMVSQECR
jgi:hypothetical protein